MKFLEHKAKEVFARYGIPVPRGVVASRPEDIVDPPLPCMVKAQVLVGGRGKAGGIRPANTLDEARTVAGEILGMNIGGDTGHPGDPRAAARVREGAVPFLSVPSAGAGGPPTPWARRCRGSWGRLSRPSTPAPDPAPPCPPPRI